MEACPLVSIDIIWFPEYVFTFIASEDSIRGGCQKVSEWLKDHVLKIRKLTCSRLL